MEKLYLLKTMLLLCALVAGSNVWAEDFELYSGTITEGDYVIVYEREAMNTTVTSNRLQCQSVTITNNVISSPKAAVIWHIQKSGDYYTLYNADAGQYAASTGTKNQAQMLESGTNDKSLWTISGESTYEFVNKANKAKNVNANLRKNGTYGFACYATGTGGPLYLYKKVKNKTATTTTIDASAIGNIDIYTNIGSNQLSASVIAGDAPVEGATVTWSSSDTNVATIDDNGAVTLVAAGTTTITAIYEGDETYATSSATYELTVTNSAPYVQPTEVEITLDNTFFGCEAFTSWNSSSGSSFTGTVNYVTVTYDKGTSQYAYINTTGIRLYDGNELTFTAPEGYVITEIVLEGASGFDTNLEAEGLSSATWTGNSSEVIITGNTNKKNMTTATITLTKVATTATITLNAACTDGDMVYGTYSNSSAFVVSDEIEVSEISIMDGKLYVEAYKTGDVVPANTGVMVSALAGGDYTVNLSSETGTSVLGEDNMLRPTGEGITAEQMTAKDANCQYYRLTMQNGETIGFWWGAEDGAAFVVGANKAYLAVPETVGARMSFWMGNESSGIADALIATKGSDRVVYDLQGRRVKNVAKGLYIVDGKKVLVK